mgnify:CR=1 FL=1
MALRIVNHKGTAELFTDIAAAEDAGLYTPENGDVVYITGENVTYEYNGATWEIFDPVVPGGSSNGYFPSGWA